MLEEDTFVSQYLEVFCKNVDENKHDYMEVLPLISFDKNPLLHTFVKMKSTQL